MNYFCRPCDVVDSPEFFFFLAILVTRVTKNHKTPPQSTVYSLKEKKYMNSESVKEKDIKKYLKNNILNFK